jgi:acetyltransferase-like isoleucine patch superfamily enzyme
MGRSSIGERTYLGNYCYVTAHPRPAQIVIGRCCTVGHNVDIRTTDYPRLPDFNDAFDTPSSWASIVVGDCVWIGNHAGVHIGSNSIIGANSVVTHDVEPGTVGSCAADSPQGGL